MELKYLSASRMKMWQTCKLQYYAVYILKVPRIEEDHYKTRIGSAVHKALELAGKAKRISSRPAWQDPLNHVQRSARKYGVSEHEQEITNLVNVASKWGWLNDKSAVEERRFMLPVSKVLGKQVNALGFIDRLSVQGDTAIVMDAKTQAKPLSRNDLAEGYQTHMYNWAVRQMYPQVRTVLVEFWTLRHKMQSYVATQADADRFQCKMEAVASEILSLTKPPEGTPTNVCRWCQYRVDCPSIPTAY